MDSVNFKVRGPKRKGELHSDIIFFKRSYDLILKMYAYDLLGALFNLKHTIGPIGYAIGKA